jgi:hypothetical protein
MTKKLIKTPHNRTITEIKAPPAVVHIKHSITLRQYKLWVILLQRYQEIFQSGELPDEDDFYLMRKKDIDDLIGYQYRKDEMKRDLWAIRDEHIELNYLEKGGTPVIHGLGFISEFKLTDKTIRFTLPSFCKKVMQGLDQPKAMFQLINWQIFNHFTGKYEAVIYKLCRDYVGIGKVPYMTIAEFRDYMGLKDGEHKDFMALNRRTIVAPIKKINESEVSDITVSVEYRRDGRKVLGLIFKAEKKYQQVLPFMEFEENHAFKFAKVAINAKQQNEYLGNHTPEEIALCIERANLYGEQLISKGKTAEYGAIYRKAITEGWHEQYAEQKALQTKIEQDKKTAQTKTRATQTETERTEQAQKEQNEKLWVEFKAMPESERTRIIEAVQNKSQTMKTQYIKHGEDGALFRSNIIVLLKKERGIA